MIRTLKEAGIGDILEAAAGHIERCGHTGKQAYNALNGSIDVEAALLLACGYRGVIPAILEDPADLLPEGRRVYYTEAYWCFDVWVGGVNETLRNATTTEVATLLRRCADTIQVSL